MTSDYARLVRTGVANAVPIATTVAQPFDARRFGVAPFTEAPFTGDPSAQGRGRMARPSVPIATARPDAT